MMNGERLYFDVDLTAMKDLTKRLDGNDLRKAFRAAFRRSALRIKHGVQKEVKDSTPPHRDHAKTYTRRGYFYGLPLYRDVKMAVYRREIGANVTLCNPKRDPNRAYILRILNVGTVQRATKRGHYRGSVRALNFFQKGVDATRDQAITELGKNLREAIMKQINK